MVLQPGVRTVAIALVAASASVIHGASNSNDFDDWQVATKYQKDSSQMSNWKVKSNVGNIGRMVSSDYCLSINSYCADYKCCSGLVCEPVYWDGELQPICVVPDASQFKGDACYGDEHVCYFNYQCCSGRCIDDDGDLVFTCEVDPDHPYEDNGLDAGVPTSSTTSTTSTSTSTQEPARNPYTPETVDTFSVHFGKVDSHIPLITMGWILVAMVAVALIVVAKVRRESSEDIEPIQSSIDISAPQWMGSQNRYDGWYFDGDAEDSNVEVATVGGYQVVPGSDEFVESPPIPNRDYSPDSDAIGYQDVPAAAPPRPHVDYEPIQDSPARPDIDYN